MVRDEQRSAWIAIGPRTARAAVDRLALDLAHLARHLGYSSPAGAEAARSDVAERRHPMPAHLLAPAEAMLRKGRDWLDPQWLWLPLAVRFDPAHDAIEVLPPHAGRLAVGRLVRTQLRGAQALAAFVVTIGPRVEREARAMMSAILEGYILDTVGSLAVEACADLLAAEVKDAAADLGWLTTNRFSPGYCTWETGDQHALFGLLPSRPAGISLNASALMHPIKSVSGVIGLGESVVFRPYPCDVCAMEHCHQRLTASRL